MSLAELYARHSLPPGSKTIRVLNIESVPELTPNALDEPVRCTLCPIDLDLDDRPKFTALSYVWGVDPPTPQHFLHCGELRIPVTKNCESALRHLRQTMGCLTIWVDAVCINQADDAEKARQIPLMGDIYTSADPVYVWLGEATPGTDRAMRHLNQGSLEKYFSPPRPYAAAWSLVLSPWSRVHCPIPLHSNRKPLISTENYTDVEDLKEVFDWPWINRVWTYQEILLAKKPVVVCGTVHVAWHTLDCALQFFSFVQDIFSASTLWRSIASVREEFYRSSTQPFTTACLDHEAYRFFLECTLKRYKLITVGLAFLIAYCIIALTLALTFCFVDRKIWLGINFLCLLPPVILPLCLHIVLRRRSASVQGSGRGTAHLASGHIVHSLYYRRATDPKDMVFGISAVLKQQSGTPFAVPDYSDDTGDTYRHFTASLLRDRNLVDVLVYAAAQHYPGQPSWVPDWAAQDRQPWGDRLQSMPTFDADKIHHRISDAEHFVSKISLDENGRCITLWAYRIATISMCVSVRETSGRFDPSQRHAHLENLRWLQLQRGIDRAGWETTPAGRRFVKWSSEKSPTEMLNLLTHLDATHQIVKDYFSIVKLQANLQIATFKAPTLVPDPSYSYHGQCSLSGRVGDQILQIQGLYPALLVRPRQEAGNAVELISPVILHTGKFQPGKVRLWEHVMERRYELPFEEYSIY